MIPKVVKGSSPTLLNTEKANELIEAINKLNALTIEYGDALEVINGTRTITIKIPRPLDELKKQHAQETASLGLEPFNTLMKKKIKLCENGEVEERDFLVYPTAEELEDTQNEFVQVMILP